MIKIREIEWRGVFVARRGLCEWERRAFVCGGCGPARL